MKANNKAFDSVLRRNEISDLDSDIAKIELRLRNSRFFMERMAYKRLLIILKIWKKRGMYGADSRGNQSIPRNNDRKIR